MISVILSFQLTSIAEAFEIYPEFQNLTENEALVLDNPGLIDSESQSDFLTYMKPVVWDQSFHSADKVFDFTLGSLSGTLFLQESRIKLWQNLATGLDFRLTHFQQRDIDIDQTHTVLELVKNINPFLAVSVYGEPSFFKRETDLGAALLLYPTQRHELRLFHTWVDITRAAHSDRPNEFVKGSEPRTLGLVGRCRGCLGLSIEQGQTDFSNEEESTRTQVDTDWLEYFIRWETPTRWIFTDTDLEYRYRRFVVGSNNRMPFGVERPTLNTRLQYTEKDESVEALANNDEMGLDRKIFEALASLEIPLLSASRSLLGSGRTLIEPGIGWFHRHWTTQASQTLDHRNLMPFIWFKAPTFYRGPKGWDRVEVGYEMTIFRADGDSQLAASQLKRKTTEQRLNLRYVFALNNTALLSFAVTGDIDAATRGESAVFEGGNGQFRIVF